VWVDQEKVKEREEGPSNVKKKRVATLYCNNIKQYDYNSKTCQRDNVAQLSGDSGDRVSKSVRWSRGVVRRFKISIVVVRETMGAIRDLLVLQGDPKN
jgi:hypothetical protein